jgi:hypothetical protein
MEKELSDANDRAEALQQQLHESEATNPWESNMWDLVIKLTTLLADSDISTLVVNLAAAKKHLHEASQLLGASRTRKD